MQRDFGTLTQQLASALMDRSMNALDPVAGALARFQTAKQMGDLATIDQLLEAGQLPPLPTDLGAKVMRMAVFNGRESTVRLLLRAGVQPDEVDEDLKTSVDPMTPLWMAARDGHHELVEILISAGASLALTDSRGANLLHNCVEHPDVARTLLHTGIPVNSTDRTGNTPLHYAARTQDGASCVKLLVQHGADIEARSATGMTPLLTATMHGIDYTFAYLTSAGADAAVRDEEDRGIFEWAMHSSDEYLALHAIDKHPAVAPTGDRLDRALVDAVRKGFTRLTAKLAELGADVGQKPDGRTLLQCAPRNAEDLKRLLRSLKTGTAITSAMHGNVTSSARTPISGAPLL